MIGNRLSGSNARVNCPYILVTLCAIGAVAILSWLNCLSVQAHFPGWKRLPSHSVYAVEARSSLLNECSVCSQHTIGSGEERTTTVHSGSNNVYSISDSDSYTMYTYLPLIMSRYTPPLCNGDFEIVTGDLAACWEREGALSVTIAATNCYSGTHCALLGSPDYPCNLIPLGYGRIYQTFGVPLTGTPKLSFRYRIFSYDELGQDRFDSFEVYIDSIFDEVPPIRILIDGSQDGRYDRNCDGSDLDDKGWKQYQIDLNAIPDGDGGKVDYRGKTVQLSFDIYSRELPPRTIGWYNTWVYVDDVQIRQD